MYSGMVDRTHAVDAAPLPPADICGGGHGNACDLAMSGTVAPNSPADVIKKSLRVDMFPSPERPGCCAKASTIFHANYIGVSRLRPCRRVPTARALQQVSSARPPAFLARGARADNCETGHIPESAGVFPRFLGTVGCRYDL